MKMQTLMTLVNEVHGEMTSLFGHENRIEWCADGWRWYHWLQWLLAVWAVRMPLTARGLIHGHCQIGAEGLEHSIRHRLCRSERDWPRVVAVDHQQGWHWMTTRCCRLLESKNLHSLPSTTIGCGHQTRLHKAKRSPFTCSSW